MSVRVTYTYMARVPAYYAYKCEKCGNIVTIKHNFVKGGTGPDEFSARREAERAANEALPAHLEMINKTHYFPNEPAFCDKCGKLSAGVPICSKKAEKKLGIILPLAFTLIGAFAGYILIGKFDIVSIGIAAGGLLIGFILKIFVGDIMETIERKKKKRRLETQGDEKLFPLAASVSTLDFGSTDERMQALAVAYEPILKEIREKEEMRERIANAGKVFSDC